MALIKISSGPAVAARACSITGVKGSTTTTAHRGLRLQQKLLGTSSLQLSNNVQKDVVCSSRRRVRCRRRGRAAAAVQGGGESEEEEVTIDVEATVKDEKILVLGGNGFVGSAVCRQSIAAGIDVVSLNRSGAPSVIEPWVDRVTWITGDVFSADWATVLTGVDTVVSCIGGFGSNEQMERINGDATIAAVDATVGTDVVKFIFISVHDYNLPTFAKSNGYFNGKRRAEARVFSKFPKTGVVLRPGFIYGKRRVDNFELPLDFVGEPLERLLDSTKDFTKRLESLPASDLLLAPPVSVDDVAKAVVKAVVDNSVLGVYDIVAVKGLAKSL